MSAKIERIIPPQEYERMTDRALADGFYSDDRRVFLPGMAWYQPWYFDPTGESEKAGKRVMCNFGQPFLSVHYWRDWAHIRPPICVVCPNGEQWEIDRKSSNGDGWQVTGDLPNITCSPSIVVPGYHGFLREGQFTPDIEGRGPNGMVRTVTP